MKNEQDSSLVLALDDASACLSHVGGKGSSLARLGRSWFASASRFSHYDDGLPLICC